MLELHNGRLYSCPQSGFQQVLCNNILTSKSVFSHWVLMVFVAGLQSQVSMFGNLFFSRGQ